MVERIDAVAPARIMDWPAIFAGAAIAAGTTVIFTGFNAALGLGSASAESGEGMGTFATILVGLFAFLTMIGSYALGAYVVGRMRTPVASGSTEETTARDGIHGLTMWAISTLIGAILTFGVVSAGLRAATDVAGSVADAGGQAVGGALQGAGQVVGGVVGGVGQVAGGAISGAGQLIGGAAQGVGQAAGEGGLSDMLPQGAQGDPLGYITDRLLRPQENAANQYSNEDIQREIAGIVGTVLRTGELPEDDRTYLEGAVAARTSLSPAEVEQRIDDAVTAVNTVRDEAQQRLDQARKAAEDAAAMAQTRAEQLQAEAAQRLEEAKQQAIDAAETARRGAVWAAFILAASSLIAGGVSFLAAVKGGKDRDDGRVWGGLTHR